MFHKPFNQHHKEIDVNGTFNITPLIFVHPITQNVMKGISGTIYNIAFKKTGFVHFQKQDEDNYLNLTFVLKTRKEY